MRPVGHRRCSTAGSNPCPKLLTPMYVLFSQMTQIGRALCKCNNATRLFRAASARPSPCNRSLWKVWWPQGFEAAHVSTQPIGRDCQLGRNDKLFTTFYRQLQNVCQSIQFILTKRCLPPWILTRANRVIDSGRSLELRRSSEFFESEPVALAVLEHQVTKLVHGATDRHMGKCTQRSSKLAFCRSGSHFGSRQLVTPRPSASQVSANDRARKNV